MSGAAAGPGWGLDGQVVLVTGATGAIGAAIARGFAAAGAKVAVVDMDAARCAALADEMPGQHVGVAADLTRTEALDDLVATVVDSLGPVSVLVNVAGVIKRTDDLFSVRPADWDLQHDINIKAVFFLSQAVAAGMRDRGRGGAIINYTSQGWMSGGFGGSVVYNSAKGAVTTMTRGLARSWAPLGIRVNAVAPGLVDTPMLRLPGSTEAEMEALAATVPMRRLGLPEDHVGATLFLASDHAGYMTGAVMNVSGGFLMY